jgi:hypothetical protein
MTKGFGGFAQDESKDGKARITIDQSEVDKLMKEYKSIKKYMRSPIFEVKKLDGTETYINTLINESKDFDL